MCMKCNGIFNEASITGRKEMVYTCKHCGYVLFQCLL